MCFRISGHQGRCWTTLRQGGFFMELGVHLADLSRHLMGPISHVTGHTLRVNEKRATEDYTHALLQFSSKAVGSIIVSANHRTTRQGLLIGRVLGEKGRIDFTIYPYQRANNSATLTLDGGKSTFVPDVKVTKLKLPKLPSPTKVYPGFFDVYEKEVAAFVNAAITGTAPPVTFEDGRSAVEVVLAVYDNQSQSTKKPNFTKRRASYRTDVAGHPLLAK
jgi:predicted dehydrogenase